MDGASFARIESTSERILALVTCPGGMPAIAGRTSTLSVRRYLLSLGDGNALDDHRIDATARLATNLQGAVAGVGEAHLVDGSHVVERR